MAASFNRVYLLGNLTRDPELRTVKNAEKSLCEFTLAINEHRSSGGENTLFVDITAWERTAENICQYMRKGNSLLVEGRLSQDKWVDKDTGKNMSKLRLTAITVQFVSGRGEGGGESGGHYETPAHDAPAASSNWKKKEAGTVSPPTFAAGEEAAAPEDDIPF